MTIIFSLIQTAVILAVAPLSVGLIRKFKARFGNRVGASVWQPYRSLAVLCRKEMTVTRHASWIFYAAPFAVLATSLIVAFLVPTLGVFGASLAWGNLFLIAALLMLGAGALVLGGMDAASAFGGMGASREMTIAALTEPVTIMVFVALGATTGAWSGGGVLTALANAPWYLTHPFLVFVFAALAMIVLAEGARYPVDNPSTHLELTMVHEAMVLEYSGPYLAMLEYAAALKYVVLAVFLANLVFPTSVLGTGAGLAYGLALFAVKLVGVCFLTAFLESMVAKMRFYRLQEFFTAAYLLVFFGLLLSLIF